MKKLALLLTLTFVAGVAVVRAEDKPAAAPAAPAAAEKAAAPAAEKAPAAKAEAKAVAAKTHEVKDAEVVSTDVEKKTLTVKGEKDNMTAPVEGAKALATLKTLKAGEKVNLTCKDNEKGEHVAVTGIAIAKPAAAPAEKK